MPGPEMPGHVQAPVGRGACGVEAKPYMLSRRGKRISGINLSFEIIKRDPPRSSEKTQSKSDFLHVFFDDGLQENVHFA